MLVQAFVPQATIEAFDQAVLYRFSRRDVVPFHLAILLPLEHGIRRQLGAVVGDHHAGEAAHHGDPVQRAGRAVANSFALSCPGPQPFSSNMRPLEALHC